MADTKISALPSASTPLTGTEVLPIVQGAANFKVSIADVTAGRAVSALSFAGPLNGTVGATTANTGAFTTLTTSSTVTLNGGTANGVAYLDGSNVLTTGSALTFEGGTLVSGSGIRANSFMEIRSNTGALYWENAANTLYWAQKLTGSDFAWDYFNGSSVSEQMRLTSSLLSVVPGATIEGLTVGRGAGAVATNTAVGAAALSANASGAANTALGYQALKINTASDNTSIGANTLQVNVGGSSNVAVGSLAMITNTSGSYNVAVGAGIAGLLQGALGLNSSGSNNTAIGYAALRSNDTASNNTAVGYQASYSNTVNGNTTVGYQTGYSNTTGGVTALGFSCLYANTTGVANTAMGYRTLDANTTGGYNTAFGEDALGSNTTASYNTAVGYQAGYTSTTADITAFGSFALTKATTASQNTAIGQQALKETTTGGYNTAVGFNSMVSNTTGANNTAMGLQALQANTTASDNTAVGYQAGYSNTTGTSNTFVGYQAGYSSNYSGNAGNVCVGVVSGYSLTTGVQNTFIGSASGSTAAGYYVTTGSKNTILGGYTGNQGGLDIRTADNYIVLSDGDGNPRGIFDGSGNFLVGTTSTNETSGTGGRFGADGYVRSTRAGSTGAASTLDVYSTGASAFRFYVDMAGTVFATNTTISAISDQRLKENVQDLDAGLDKIMALQPRKFDWKEGKGKNIKGDRGWIAQEFEQVFPDMIDTWKDEAPEGEEPYKSVRADLIPVLVKAMQEQQAIIESLKARLDAANL